MFARYLKCKGNTLMLQYCTPSIILIVSVKIHIKEVTQSFCFMKNPCTEIRGGGGSAKLIGEKKSAPPLANTREKNHPLHDTVGKFLRPPHPMF